MFFVCGRFVFRLASMGKKDKEKKKGKGAAKTAEKTEKKQKTKTKKELAARGIGNFYPNFYR
jgi:hypothetical protein